MTQSKDEQKDTVVATTAIVKNRFISIAGGQGSIAVGNGVGSQPNAPLGVAWYDAKIGELVAVVCNGTAKVECAGPLVNGSGVQVQADGRVINAGGVSNFYGRSKTTTITAGQLAEIDLRGGQ
jgi:Uncharacterized conserved protein (DUF2190)